MGGGELAVAVMLPQAADISQGASLLRDMVGSDAMVAAMVEHGCLESGLEPTLAEKLLPLLAMLVGGYLAARIDGASLAGQGGDAELVAMLMLDGRSNSLDMPPQG